VPLCSGSFCSCSPVLGIGLPKPRAICAQAAGRPPFPPRYGRTAARSLPRTQRYQRSYRLCFGSGEACCRDKGRPRAANARSPPQYRPHTNPKAPSSPGPGLPRDRKLDGVLVPVHAIAPLRHFSPNVPESLRLSAGDGNPPWTTPAPCRCPDHLPFSPHHLCYEFERERPTTDLLLLNLDFSCLGWSGHRDSH
jgi:hypothetical protein